MQCNVLSSRNSHENIEIMVNSYITPDCFLRQRCRNIHNKQSWNVSFALKRVIKVNYHDKCYSSFANVNKLDRERKRFAESINIGESSVIKRKKEGHHLLEKRVTMITNVLEQYQRLNNMTKLCV